MAAKWLVLEPWVASRRTAARTTPGAICLSNSGHFPAMVYSNVMKPVAATRPRQAVQQAGANRIDDGRGTRL
jgi:hypothetical protein